MNIKFIFLPILGVAALLLTGCQSSPVTTALALSPNQTQSHSDTMDEGYWQLMQAQVDGKSLVISAPITLAVSKEGFSGQSAVNRYRAEVKLHNGMLEVNGNIQTTRMAGPIKQMRLESDYLSALRRVNQYQRHGEQLLLSGEGVSLQYRATQP